MKHHAVKTQPMYSLRNTVLMYTIRLGPSVILDRIGGGCLFFSFSPPPKFPYSFTVRHFQHKVQDNSKKNPSLGLDAKSSEVNGKIHINFCVL